jgi:TIR domain/Pentapeptide repeats (8 copies)
MAIQEQLNILQKGVAIWNSWRASHKEVRIDLGSADLSKFDLKEIFLMDASLKHTNLSRANLNGAFLSETDLSYANLSQADSSKALLINSNLSRANLNGADLSGAYLMKANLNGADLSGADLNGAFLSEANLSGANFNGANLNRATIGGTILTNLDLSTVQGLNTIKHGGPSPISTSTLERSKGEIPDIFLKGVGVSDNLIEYARSLFSRPIEYYTCFISYSSKDELFARRLHNDLQQEGVRCWFAPEDLNIGDKIKHRIDESIRLHDKLLLILSEYSMASNWVAYEVERALKKEPEGIPNVLYPVCVDRAIDRAIATHTEAWVKEIMDTRHIGNFEEWMDPQKYQKSFNRLLRALNMKKRQEKS